MSVEILLDPRKLQLECRHNGRAIPWQNAIVEASKHGLIARGEWASHVIVVVKNYVDMTRHARDLEASGKLTKAPGDVELHLDKSTNELRFEQDGTPVDPVTAFTGFTIRADDTPAVMTLLTRFLRERNERQM